jgi:hypothetical protein
LTFAVSLDDRPIGVHGLRIVDAGATRVVESAASFDGRILRVPRKSSVNCASHRRRNSSSIKRSPGNPPVPEPTKPDSPVEPGETLWYRNLFNL